MKILTSKSIYISGSLGPLKLLKKSPDHPKNTENAIGEHGGNEFFIGCPLPTSTYLIFYGIRDKDLTQQQNKHIEFQITTTFFTKRGEKIVRVSTIRRDHSMSEDIIHNNFD